MEINYEKMVRDLLVKAAKDCNQYRMMIAINNAKGHDEETKTWNRARAYSCQELAEELAKILDVSIRTEIVNYKLFEGTEDEFEVEYPCIRLI